MTLVSIVVPVYGVRPYLPVCVDSLLAQTHAEVEIVLVDDGSVDGSREICLDYAARYPQVRTVRRTNGGLSAARNTGLEMASGEYIMFVDADDWLAPEGVASMLQRARDTNADVVIAGYYLSWVDSTETTVRSAERRPPQILFDASQSFAIPVTSELLNFVGYAWNKLYRRSSLGAARFPEGVALVEDILFNAPLLRTLDRVSFVPECYLHYIQRDRQSLGTGYQPNFVDLLAQASQVTLPLIRRWGLDEAEAQSVINQVEHGRIQWALRAIALDDSLDWRRRCRRVNGLLGSPSVRDVLRERLIGLPFWSVQRPLLWTQTKNWAMPVVGYYVLRKAVGA